MRQYIFGILPIFWMAFFVISIESRSVTHAVEDDATAEDFDLENALSDYYDNLMELWGLGQKIEEKQKNEEEEKMKPKREEGAGNYLSRALYQVPNATEYDTKSFYDLTVPIQIGNITYRFLNESHAAVLDRQRANRERDTDEGNSTRIKSLRLDSIKESVLSLRGGNSSHDNTFTNAKQTKTLKDMFEKQTRESGTNPIPNQFTEKSLSFFPSCEIPINTDEAAWLEPYSMNLYFDVYFPAPQLNSTHMVVNAALKLFPISQINHRPVNVPNYELVSDDDKRIRISVYWHTRSLRRHRIKRKLLDSQMMSLNGENSLTFDIRPAVRSWKESGKNFGLQIIVEDENGTLQRPRQYLHPMNCSSLAADVKPLPLFGFDSAAQYFLEEAAIVEEGNKSEQDSNSPYRPVKFPILGLQMRDLSLSVVQNLLQTKSAQMDLASNHNRKDIPSRITDFENVPLGVPLNRSNDSKVTRDNLKLIAK